MPRSSFLLTAAMGIVLGVGWAFVTGALVADSYDVHSAPRTPISRPS